MIAVMIFISCLYDSFNKFMHGAAGVNSGEPNVHSSFSSIYLIIQLRWSYALSLELGGTGERADTHEMA